LATKTITIDWQWATDDHWGNPVTPTGFIVERKFGLEDYVLLTYEVLPHVDPSNIDYSYDHILTDNEASRVFALGEQLSYRVRTYWVV
jgi:hypothetical protein